MHSIVNTLSPARHRSRAEATSSDAFRKPNYDCQEMPDAVKLVVYIPGVEATAVDVEARGPDLMITARKSHFVRVNWQALHLESAQRDYQLRLRLGTGFDYATMQAEMRDGILTVTLPKRLPHAVGVPARLRRVA